MDDTQDVYFSPAEEEMIESIQEIYGVTEYEAKKAVISNKNKTHGCINSAAI